MRTIIDIKNRKQAILETSQITKAMELISVSKLNRINNLLEANREYFNAVRGAIKDIVSKNKISHPYFSQGKDAEKPAYIIIASDKGLAGDYNRNILRFAGEIIPKKSGGVIYPVGEEAAEFFSKRDIAMDKSFVEIGQHPGLNTARKFTAILEDDYRHGVIDGVNIFYTDKGSGTLSKPTHLRLLPITPKDFADTQGAAGSGYDFHYHPDMKEVLGTLVPEYLLGMVYSTLIQSAACEHLERIRTMHSATLNAEELMEKLDLQYNRLRQEAITTELAELSSTHNIDKE